MNKKVTLEELKEVKANFPRYLLSIALEPINAAFEAIDYGCDSVASKENFLKVVASDFDVIYFIGKACLAVREEEKSELAIHAFYLFDRLLNK